VLGLGLITVVNNRTLCVRTIRGGCEPGDVVKGVTFMPCHFKTSVSSFRMFGHMLCYLISTLITNNAGLGFYFQEFNRECHIVADYFDDSLQKRVVDVLGCNSGYLIYFLNCLIEFSLSVAIKK